MFKWIETWGMAKCEPKEFGLDGLERRTLNYVLDIINIPGTKDHQIKYNSVLELKKPVSNSPEGIADFLVNAFEQNYELSRPEIKHEIYTGKLIEKHYIYLNTDYKSNSFLHKGKDKFFSAVVKFKRELNSFY